MLLVTIVLIVLVALTLWMTCSFGIVYRYPIIMMLVGGVLAVFGASCSKILSSIATVPALNHIAPNADTASSLCAVMLASVGASLMAGSLFLRVERAYKQERASDAAELKMMARKIDLMILKLDGENVSDPDIQWICSQYGKINVRADKLGAKWDLPFERLGY